MSERMNNDGAMVAAKYRPMDTDRIEQLLDTCGDIWLGGQKSLVRSAMEQLAREMEQSAVVALEAAEGRALAYRDLWVSAVKSSNMG